ncbi:MAG: hypothetical protein ACJ716_16185 [Marmoricola sp.]
MKLWGRVLVVALVSILFSSALPTFAADPPKISVRLNRSVFVAGQTAVVTVVVSGAGSGKYLRVTLTRANHTSNSVSTGAYDDTFRFDFSMYIDSSVRTELIDTDKTTVLASNVRALPVRAAVGSAIAGYYQQSGSYAVFARTAQPIFRSATTPPRKYRCIKHEVWRKEGSTWQVVGLSSCKYENSQGVVTWKWVGHHSSGTHYRVRARFLGDSLNHANNGAFIYFTFK